MKKILLPLFIFFAVSATAQGTIKTMFYNVLEYPSAPPENREDILRDIVHEYEPDIFMIAELETEAGAQEILDESLNFYADAFSAAPFVENTSTDWDDELQQLIFYRTNTFNLVETDIIQTYLRDINMYKLELIDDTDTGTGIFFYVFVTHLKASSGEDNEQDRLDMVNDFTAYLNQLPADANVIFAGDLNLYSAYEPAYAELLDLSEDNPIDLADPIDIFQDWHNNESLSAIHTQSTRISNSSFDDFGAGGGLDDRFDFILLSENLMNQDAPVHYVEGSYASFGNNGNCFNDNINDNDCSGTYSQSLRIDLYNMSDHLPVVLEIETGQSLDVAQRVAEAKVVLPEGNIVKNNLIIEVPASVAKGDLYIYNLLGQKVQQVKAKNLLTINANVASLTPGIYFAVFENSKVAPIKFIKTL